ncbi:response regulator [Albimonas pacifica]|uniref:PAS fold-containing protein n=1 Tax=Albimonas pacifica TaxID=1114924 RepID=A0A1I3BPC4_9RHOB|nr:response regulator [Albimonas pacifica]SFH64097.1 PAS fold-containing protein [Albimonas pacifica]
MLTEAIPPDDLDRVRAMQRQAMERGGTFGSERRLRRADGAWRWRRVSAAPSLDRAAGAPRKNGPLTARYRLHRADGVYRRAESRLAGQRDGGGVVTRPTGALLDVDDEVRPQEELRRALDRLAQASRASSLAELAASIAHEANQPRAAGHGLQPRAALHGAGPPRPGRAPVTVPRPRPLSTDARNLPHMPPPPPAVVGVVDDDPRLRAALSELLESAGCEACVRADGRALLDDPDFARLDCLVADIGMAGMDGLQLEALARARRPDLPVILITGRPETAERLIADGRPARLIFRKPFDAQALLAAIEAEVALRRG